MEQHMGYSSFHSITMFFIRPRCNWMWTSPPELSRLLGLPIHHHPSPGHRMRPRPDVSQVKNPQGTESEKTTGWKFHIWMFPKIVVKSQIIHGLIGFSIINHPFWGKHPYFWKHPFIIIYSLWGWILSWHFPLAFRDQQSLFDTTQEPTKRGLQIQIGQLLQHQHHTQNHQPGSNHLLRMVMEPKYLAEEVIIHPIIIWQGDWILRAVCCITWKSSRRVTSWLYTKKSSCEAIKSNLYISTDFPQETPFRTTSIKWRVFFSRGNRLFWKEWLLFCFTFFGLFKIDRSILSIL